MPRIRLLDKETSELIAAGEVVDRPASVVKELVENSLDAGARNIEIELTRGGLGLLRVTDDGCGMEPEDMPTALMRHATSKISRAADLDSIGTLGFRGEALAATSAVSRMSLISKTPGSDFGYELTCEGGERGELCERGAPDGTTIIVRDLFYNTPARMKFLKKDVYEGNAAQTLVEQLALSHPETAFRLIREGKTVLVSPGDGRLYSAAYALLPAELADGLMQLGHPGDALWGFIARPAAARKTRGYQYLFVNGRLVRSRSVTAAIEEAYRGFVTSGRYPAFILNLTLPTETVDVNVHPAKTEVRFAFERQVCRDAFGAVRAALAAYAGDFSNLLGRAGETDPADTLSQTAQEHSEPPSGRTNEYTSAEPVKAVPKTRSEPSLESPRPGGTAAFLESWPGGRDSGLSVMSPGAARPVADRGIDIEVTEPPAAQSVGESRRWSAPASPERASVADVNGPTAHEAPPCELWPGAEPSQTAIPGMEPAASVRVLGELFSTYIVAELGQNVVFIDKHAAHERILFEKLRDLDLAADRQLLLEPVVVTLTGEEKEAVSAAPEAIKKLGFALDDFGGSAVAVREIPSYMPPAAVADAISEIAAGLAGSAGKPTDSATEWLLHSLACRAAIKGGHRSPDAELIELAREIIGDRLPKYCPHGRPVFFTLSRAELEKRFGRA